MKKIFDAISLSYPEFTGFSFEQKRDWLAKNGEEAKVRAMATNGVGKRAWQDFLAFFKMTEKTALVKE